MRLTHYQHTYTLFPQFIEVRQNMIPCEIMIKLPFFMLCDCHVQKFWLVLDIDLSFRFQGPTKLAIRRICT